MPASRPVAERFWEKVEILPGSCWLWTAHTVKGYGRFKVGGHNGKSVGAHRWSYESEIGPIPDALELDHLCRVRHCVNPTHLEPVTHAENVRRGDLWKVSADKTHCPQGHEYDEVNTYRWRGTRLCRACLAAKARRRRAKNWIDDAPLDRFADTADTIATTGFPLALVAQDGMTADQLPWTDFAVLFMGGMTEYKLSEPAYELAAEANRRGKATHMGRVNSFKRLHAAALSGYSTADGTFIAIAPDHNLERVQRWMTKLDANQPLPLL